MYYIIKYIEGQGKKYLSRSDGWVDKEFAWEFRDIHEATRVLKTKCSGDYDAKVVKEDV